MTKWELNKFKVEKSNDILTFETEISVLEIRKNFAITIIYNYNDKKITVKGNVNLKQDYTLYELITELERLLNNPLIKELSKHSRKQEYRRDFMLTEIKNYQEGILANLRFVYNDKYLEVGSVLIYPTYKDPNKLCNVDLTVETNAAANVKIFYDILNTICLTNIKIFVDINRINKVLNVILQKLQTVYTQTVV